MPIHILIIILVIMTITIIWLSIRLILFKHAVKNINERINFILSNETNIGIDLILKEKNLNILIKSLNKELDSLKNLKNNYRKKDLALRESITNISHDLRTPLTVIISYINLIERSTNENMDEKLRKSLAIIKDRTTAMNILIEELFNYSLFETEQFQLVLEDICLNNALEKTLTDYYYSFNECGITPKIDICSTPIYRKLNDKALDRILNNILSNALKYSDGDFAITLEKNGKMTFTNTANRMDCITAGKLFDRFFTVENARSSTGLGLSIAKILTERMNGTISVELINHKLQINLTF